MAKQAGLFWAFTTTEVLCSPRVQPPPTPARAPLGTRWAKTLIARTQPEWRRMRATGFDVIFCSGQSVAFLLSFRFPSLTLKTSWGFWPVEFACTRSPWCATCCRAISACDGEASTAVTCSACCKQSSTWKSARLGSAFETFQETNHVPNYDQLFETSPALILFFLKTRLPNRFWDLHQWGPRPTADFQDTFGRMSVDRTTKTGHA